MATKQELTETARAADAISWTIGTYRAVDLSRKLEPGIPSYPTHPKYFQMRWCSKGDPAEMNQLIMGEHTGTHIDAPSHFVPDLEDPARRHINEIGLDTFFGRALKLRFGPFNGANEQVSLAQVRDWEKDHLPLQKGDIVLLDFQWGERWGLGPKGFAFLEGWPGIDREAAAYFVDRGVKLVGTDCVSLDAGDGGGGELPAHYTLLPNGVLIIENVANLKDLPVVSFFMALPMPVDKGTGAPVRAVAFVPRR